MLLNRGSVGAQEAPRTVSIEGAQVCSAGFEEAMPSDSWFHGGQLQRLLYCSACEL